MRTPSGRRYAGTLDYFANGGFAPKFAYIPEYELSSNSGR